MRAVIIGILFLFASLATEDEGCWCGTDFWEGSHLEPVFAEDPLVEKGYGFITEVQELNVNVQDGECVIWNTFPDAPADHPTYFDESMQMELMKIQWVSQDEVFLLTLNQVKNKAKEICWGEPALS